MNKIYNEQGCRNLINAIYQRAAEDYILAVISGNKELENEAGNFLVSGAYFKEHKEGRYIKKKCLEEIAAAQKFIDDFLESDSEKIEIHRKDISFPVLLAIKNIRYKDKLRFKTTFRNNYKYKFYLCKK